nr:immunoglobulin heavy chain junction region [Mus musculus]
CASQPYDGYYGWYFDVW